MTSPDIRWKQRYDSFSKALKQPEKFIQKKDSLNELEKQGLIQAFESNFELSWNLIKDFYEYQGVSDIQGSRDAFRLAFSRGIISNGEDWMKMLASRIKSSHTYNEETAEEISAEIINNYFKMFSDLHQKFSDLINDSNK